MRKKFVTIVFTAALALALAMPLFGGGTAAAHQGHTSCAGGMPDAAEFWTIPGPADGFGQWMSDEATSGPGVVAGDLETDHSSRCAPGP